MKSQVGFDISGLQTPCYVVDEARLIKNLEILRAVSKDAGCRILLAQKAFSMYYFYPLIGRYLHGTAASGLFEARLGFEAMGKENHVFSPAYREEEFGEIARICDHIVFNSFSQWERFERKARESGASLGIRINPECSTQSHAIYDPCAPASRLGVVRANFPKRLPDGIEGLHFHTLCEQNADALVKTLGAVEERFGDFLHGLKWVNFGGGHHITRADYDTELLINTVRAFRERYGAEVYLEPGEAVALDAGYLVTTVADIVKNDMEIAVLDASAACHMPDVIEMPYRPGLAGAGRPGEKAYTYRLGGPTCLAGDIVGDYSFEKPLKAGDRLVFLDMAHYTMVKTNTFNGMALPSIYAVGADRRPKLVRRFGYEDFKTRLS